MKRATTLKPPKRTSARSGDADNPPWREEMLGPAVIRRGRGPQRAPTKVLTTLRLDADVLEYFRATGAGFQTRINEALRLAKERGEARGAAARVVDATKPPEAREPKARYRASTQRPARKRRRA